MTSRYCRTTLPLSLLLIFAGCSMPLAAQLPATQPTAPAAVPAAAMQAPSGVLKPGIDSLRQALGILRPEKWKASGPVTSEAVSDIGSINRDLDNTLPPLLAAADAAPNSMPQLLPAYRNVEALYDVLVRVTQTAVLAAPPPQSVALQQATQSMQQGRREFGDLLDTATHAQDRQFRDVQLRLQTLQNRPLPPAPVCPPPPAPVKKPRPRVRPKPKPKPTTPSSNTQQSAPLPSH